MALFAPGEKEPVCVVDGSGVGKGLFRSLKGEIRLMEGGIWNRPRRGEARRPSLEIQK